MSTNDVPGAKTTNNDVLAMGCWAEHSDGSLILVEGVEGGRVIYSIFDTEKGVEYRDAMSEKGFKDLFSWKPAKTDSIRWTWHDKTPFAWDRVLGEFSSGQRHVSAQAQLSAAAQVAESLDLRAEKIDVNRVGNARTMLSRLSDAVEAFRR